MWWKNAIFYELYVDKFSRDFRSLIGRIGYLKDLGVDAVWVLPHYPSPMDDDGYDVSDFQNVRHELGTLDDFDLFVERAHAQNIKVVVDFVIGHTSTSHPWFVDAASSIESQYRDYYLWSNDGNQLRNSTNAFPNIKPNNWIFNPQTNDYYYATFYPSQADLNWDNEQVFSDMLANMEFWIERGVDGFRVDAVSTMIKREGTESYNLPEVHEIVKKIRKIFDDRFPDVLLLCEASGEQGEIEDYVKTGDEFHMAFNFALSRSIFLSLASGDMKYYEQALSSSIHNVGTGELVNVLTNHDTISSRELPSTERKIVLDFIDPDREFEFIENESSAVRLALALHNDRELIKKAFEMALAPPGAFVIYYGDEIEMQNAVFPKKPEDARVYVRGEFDWERMQKMHDDPDSVYNFLRTTISKRSHA